MKFPFFKHTVSSVLADVQRTVDRLHNIVEREFALADAKEEQIATLQDEVATHDDEAARAERIASRLLRFVE